MPTWLRWLCVVLWMLVIYYFSDQPNSNEVTLHYFGGLNFWVRKIAHVTEYAILFVLCRYALQQHPKATLIAFGMSVLYASTDELHQHFVFGRSASFGDVLIDSLGPVIVIALLAVIARTGGLQSRPR